MSKLFKFEWDCGRMGIIQGVFISTSEEVKSIIGKQLFLGDVLGKYSEIQGQLEEEEIKEIVISQAVVIELEETFGKTISGYNPFDYDLE